MYCAPLTRVNARERIVRRWKRGWAVIFGMSLESFTVLHVAISMIAIFVGFIVVGGMFSNAGLAGWTAFFLLATILTNVTGFMFPFTAFTPALGVGILSSLLLLVALIALYGFRLDGRWRGAYVVTALLGLYFNVFVLIVQSFQKVSFLQPLAPTGSEPSFVIAQGAALAAFVLLGVMAFVKFHPEQASV
jgi:hypothetical protein